MDSLRPSALIWIFFIYCMRPSDATCSFPTQWDGTWYDGSFPKNNIVLDQASATVTSGWSINAYSSTVTTWTCQSEDTTNNLMLFKGNQFVDLFGVYQNVFRCIKWTKLTDYSYIYYIYTNEEPNARYTATSLTARILIEAYDAAVTSWSTSTYCNPSNGVPTTEEYVVMVKQGFESQVSQYCCKPFLITAAYTHNDGSTTTCGTGSVWDVCSDRTQMTVNMTQCTTKQYYSADGNAVCVYSTSSGNTYYQTVLNTDSSVDYSTTYRLTCYAVTTSGSNVVASDSLGSCENGQSPTSKASDGTGTLTFTPYLTCLETTTTTPPVPQRSDISCDADTIDTFVPISMLPSGAPLTWRDPSCKVTSNGTHMISSIGHNQCGTTVTITKDTVEFENELTAQISNHSANTLIDFGENSYVIPVKCIYPRTETPMTSYVPLQQHVRFYEKRYGHFDVDITQYDSDKFSSAIQGLGVPRKVALNTEIFVEVKMNDQFNNGLGIHVDKCIATPSPSPSDSTYYNLLTDGCPASQHVQLYNAPANKVRLGVRAFQFTSHNSSIVYIHCQTSMCEVGTPYCVSNCVTAGRRKRDVAPDQKSHLVSTGPFVFVADEQDDPIRMSTIVASVSLFVAVVACVAAVMGWTRKKTHKCTKEEGLL